MLNHLFATILICLGVANTTPILNYDNKESNQVLTTPKKASQTTNYELNITTSNGITADYSNVNLGYYKTGLDRETRINLGNYNNYINVIGNRYKTQSTVILNWDNHPNTPGNYNFTLFQNWETMENNTNNIYQSSLKELYIMKITPYNYNVNTETSIKIKFNIANSWGDQYGSILRADHKYLIKNVYISQDTNFDNYIGRQLTQFTAQRIIDDIENINNGFYYTKEQTITEITTNNTITDEWEQVMPNNEFFMAIEYIYAIKGSVLETDWEDYGTNYQVIPFYPNEVNTTELKISGTNIIPDGTYEVVDIPGLMFEVIGMPFAFTSQAFNLTLFPGTPYQINIANLFLSIIAIFVFVWLIMLFIKKGG